jgi:haloacetate dehalogenase
MKYFSVIIKIIILLTASVAASYAEVATMTKLKSDESASVKFFPGFQPFKVKTSSGITINGVVGGSGPPVLLLHGAPANLASWRKMAPELAKRYTIVATDLRGYGEKV